MKGPASISVGVFETPHCCWKINTARSHTREIGNQETPRLLSLFIPSTIGCSCMCFRAYDPELLEQLLLKWRRFKKDRCVVIWRRINPVVLLVVACLLFPGLPIQCKASCAMTATPVNASPSDAPQCCKTCNVSNDAQSDGPKVFGSASRCCTERTHVPSGVTVVISKESTDLSRYVSVGAVAPVPARINLDTAASSFSCLSPPGVSMPSVLDRTATLRI